MYIYAAVQCTITTHFSDDDEGLNINKCKVKFMSTF